MIIRKVFNPLAVARYMREEIIVSVALSAGVCFLYTREAVKLVSLPFSVAAILGSALAIFLAFRNNNAYGRWWEARTVWGNIVNNSRIFARQLIANTDNAAATAGRFFSVGITIAMKVRGRAKSSDQLEGSAAPSQSPSPVLTCQVNHNANPAPKKYQWARAAAPTFS